jgi:hypothetical protein
MFRKNTRHLQIPLTSHVDELPEPLRERLRNSWADTFYREFFCRLNEEPLAALYADMPSRPNVPVNVLVGLEFLKAANGWTDKEMYNEFCYNVQVRYALGYRHLGEGYFDLRTLYDFRERLARHMQETGENLLEQTFEQVIDEQVQVFSLRTGKQRMDSTLLASNIRQMGRVQLPVTVLQRVWRMLTEEDQQRYANLFAPYLKGHAGQYVYRLKKDELPVHLQRIGEEMRRLLRELEAAYGNQPTYHVLARVFTEHFHLEPEGLRVKEAGELSASSLQSPDDLEATYREKRGEGQRGYVANLTETCDPENPVPLITKVQVAPNTTDDTVLLAESVARPENPHRGGDTLHRWPFREPGQRCSAGRTSGHAGPDRHSGTTARPGAVLPGRFSGSAGRSGLPERAICPMGTSGVVRPSRSGKAFAAVFGGKACARCAERARCPVVARKRSGESVLRFTAEELRRAERRCQARRYQGAGRNLRAAIESTVRSVKHPFAGGKVPMRGRFRVACMVIGSVAVTNVRRLHRFLQSRCRPQVVTKGPGRVQKDRQERVEQPLFSPLLSIVRAIQSLRRRFLTLQPLRCPASGW